MDENSKISGDGGAPKPTATTTAAGNPNSHFPTNSEANPQAHPETSTDDVAAVSLSRQSSRTPFTNLSQVDADLALARTLQEQERAYMMLSMNGGGVGYGSWDTGIYFHDDEDDDFDDSHDHEYDEGDNGGDDEDGDEDDDEDEEDEEDDDEEDEDDMDNYDDDEEDAFDVHAHDESRENNAEGVELDPTAYSDDEAYARALQDAEEREMAARLLAMAGIAEREIVDVEDHGGNSQDTWEEVDPDELSYEELLALGEIIGTESTGLSADTIASLPSSNYKAQSTQEAETDLCVICRLDYEDGDALTTLPCKHAYHTECINNWLKINKACPVCSTEVSTSGNS